MTVSANQNLQQNSSRNLPSFSIVVETENLATADLQGLLDAIDCLEHQDPPPSQANEILLIDSGDIPPPVKQSLQTQYPWLTIHQAPPGITYYGAKMLGAEIATGDILVYYDSDCIYEPTWLRTILQSFANPEICIVAGETRTRGIGLYGTAMALAYIFPQYSGQTQLQTGSQYYLNNVAFRREFLLENPIPTELPLYRGNCVIHAKQLTCDGITIWRQPQARATHAPPNGWTHFYWRFLLIGYDYYWQKRVLKELSLDVQSIGQEAKDPTESGISGKLKVLDDRVGKLIRSNPLHLLFMPFSIPVIFVSTMLILIGYRITKRHPHRLLKRFESLEQSF
ncbi:glycosyltransferase family 2 protein [filamentous cyanobacterium LEGE 11480]|uniref:Glycosyltransferase family 2 protein n=1 Tax=Romeriopsis navalis LEGE 11480 TaxID=2777977 RepID=A0A928VNX2_9CYAN|nr:glycosyltransferase family 2 protein [Romeriopsis navalis]MBE9031133.1 glycosyltransferase family 2 protein [Romeriopsis navalis LEGE 11480]